MVDEFKDREVPIRNIRKRYIDPWGKPVRRDWGFINEPISSYEESFKNVLEGKTITGLISNHSAPIVIDLMAAPRTVYDLLSASPNGRGLAVSLPDHKPSDMREDIEEIYSAKNVRWLAEDITHPGTWNDIEQWLAGDKAHLIMERGMGGLGWLPMNKKLLGILVNKAWSFLDPNGGILLFETPRRDELLKKGVDLAAWVKSLQVVVDIKYDPGKIEVSDPRVEFAKIMITRAPNSPLIIPSV